IQTTQAIVGAGTGNCDPSNPGQFSAGPPVIPALPTTVTSVQGLWSTNGALPQSYVLVTTLDGDNRETTPVRKVDSSVNPPTITACFNNNQPAGTTLMALGGFGNGIVPPTGVANGSTGTVLKMFGDINGDGNMVYVEYTCDTVNAHKLYRNVMP